MKYKKLRLTAHAFRRLAQRGLTLSDVLLALEIGRKIYRANACFFFVGKSDLPSGTEKQLENLVGVTVVVENNHIVTAYKNSRAIARLKRKPKGYKQKRKVMQMFT